MFQSKRFGVKQLLWATGLSLLLPAALLAQQHGGGHDHDNGDEGGHSCQMMADGGGCPMMQGHDHGNDQGLSQTGDAVFAAIQEIVGLLQSDPDTDWTLVNIDALHEHLVDMHHVSINSRVNSEPVDGGARYIVTGEGRTLEAIQRMVPAHARQMSMSSSWTAMTARRADGVTLVVTSDNDADVQRIRALGFMGFMVQGDHHQPHHAQMASGGQLQGAHDDHDQHAHH